MSSNLDHEGFYDAVDGDAVVVFRNCCYFFSGGGAHNFSWGESNLDHEVFDNAVDDDAVVVAVGGVRAEVLHRLRALRGPHTRHIRQ